MAPGRKKSDRGRNGDDGQRKGCSVSSRPIARSRRHAVGVVDADRRRADWRIALSLIVVALLARSVAAFLFADVGDNAQIWEYGRQGLCAFQTHGDLCMFDRNGAAYASAYMPPLTSYLWLGLFHLFGPGVGAHTAYVALNVLIGALGPWPALRLRARCRTRTRCRRRGRTPAMHVSDVRVRLDHVPRNQLHDRTAARIRADVCTGTAQRRVGWLHCLPASFAGPAS